MSKSKKCILAITTMSIYTGSFSLVQQPFIRLLNPKTTTCYHLAFPLSYPTHTYPIIIISPPLSQRRAQRQLAAAGPDVDRLGEVGDDPVLALGIPDAQVAAGQGGAEDDSLARRDAPQAVEAAQHAGRVVRPAERHVQLRDLVAGEPARVGDLRRDAVQGVEQAGVAAGLVGRARARGVQRLRRGGPGARREEVLGGAAVVRIARGGLGVRRVEVRVDVRIDTADVRVTAVGEEVVPEVVGEVAVGRGLGGLAGRGLVRVRRQLLDAQVRVRERRVGEAEPELEDRRRVLRVDVPVVDEHALAEVLLRRPLAVVRLVEHVRPVVFARPRPREGRPARWVDSAFQVYDVSDFLCAVMVIGKEGVGREWNEWEYN